MSFTESNLSVVGGESSEGPTIYTYLVPSGDDATANFYFDSKYDTFRANDQIWTDTSGTIALLRVTSSGPALSDGVDVVAVSLGGGGGGMGQYNDVNDVTGGAESFGAQSVGDYLRVSLSQNTALKFVDNPSPFTAGDVLDFWIAEDDGGGPYTCVFSGTGGNAEFFSDGNTSSQPDYSYSQVPTRCRFIYRGSNQWDVQETYV